MFRGMKTWGSVRLARIFRLHLVVLAAAAIAAQAFPAWAAPSNDNRENAKDVGVPFYEERWTTGATTVPDEDQPGPVAGSGCPGKTMTATVWYYMELSEHVPVAIKTDGTDFDTLVAVWRVYPDGSRRLLACNDDYAGAKTSKAVFSAIVGQRYFIQVGSPDGSTGLLKFRVERHDVPNDNIADPQAIPFIPYMTVRSTDGATLEGGEERKCESIGSTVWFSYRPEASAKIYIDMSGSDFRTVVSVYRTGGTDPVNEGCGGGGLTVQLTGGITYLLQVGGVREASGILRLRVSPVPPTGVSNTLAHPTVVTNPDGSITVFDDYNRDGMRNWNERGLTIPGPPTQAVDVRFNANADGSKTVYNDRDHDGSVDQGEENVRVPATDRIEPRTKRTAEGMIVFNDRDQDGLEDPGERLLLVPLPNFNPKVKDNQDGSYTIYSDRDFDDLASPSEVILSSPPLRLRTRDRADGSIQICNDKDSNEVCDSSETLAVIPPLVFNVKTGSDGNGGTTIYNDKDSDGVNDPGEELLRVPGMNPKVRANPDGTVTIYNDSNGDDQPSAGELSVTTPVLDPKVAQGGGGSTIIYNDVNHDGSPSSEEVIVTIPGPPMLNPRIYTEPGGAITVYNDRDLDEQPDPDEVVIRVPHLSPKAELRTDGGIYVFNDDNENGIEDPAEAIFGARPPAFNGGNDARASARSITAPGTTTQGTYGSTVEAGEELPCGIRTGTVWFKHSPTAAGAVVLEVQSNPRFQPVVAIWEQTLTGSVLVGCTTRNASGSSFAFTTAARGTYLFQLGASAGDDFGTVSLGLVRL